MQISHIEHVGIAVASLEQAIPFYEKLLNTKCYKIEEVADQHVKTAFLKVGETKIELLEATSDESAIAKFIAKNGGHGRIAREGRARDRQDSSQGCRRLEHRFCTPQEHLRSINRTL